MPSPTANPPGQTTPPRRGSPPAPRPPPGPQTTLASANLVTKVHKSSALRADADLAARISTFVNIGYRDREVYLLSQWVELTDRFETREAIFDAVGSEGMFAVVWNMPSRGEGKEEEQEKEGKAEAVACACISPWTGDLGPERAGAEDGGWEIKTVTTKEGWKKMGLAGLCVQALIDEVIEIERRNVRERGEEVEGTRVKLWVHAVEEVNGEYWRRRGWRFVRAYERPAGEWASRFGFVLGVFGKEVDLGTGEVA
ncbi:hypothetical protein CC80DRAFT_495077 [Byssothecium circinans]|uniref:N-acetyltransferase domain-containing protein n=1 Tax=Byssothecium circinans TaxID=147558 RepID=A0A6A5TML6_9PLEO|nr:hypothetical protein CC80DRAFT_495077 [Byssothecium circinans]